jgi:hypothetical protein
VTAQQKVHLLCCASTFVSPRLCRVLITTYFLVRLIPQDSRALHLDLLHAAILTINGYLLK